MLNISDNKIDGRIEVPQFKSFRLLKGHEPKKIFNRILIIGAILIVVLLFMPWTQNIRAKGTVTTLHPSQRPQTIHSVIAGRIEKWFIKEGDFVKKGDTILFMSEIKPEYFDPNLLTRTEEQIKSKELSVNSYMDKVKALDNQIDAMINTKKLKINQAKNYVKQAKLKIASDSMSVEAAKIDFSIAKKQLDRMKELYSQGLKSLTDLEKRSVKYQETQSKLIASENKLLSAQNDLINAEVELSSIENQYRDKLSKVESEKYTALSSMYEAEAVVTKMQNQYMNYSIRTGFYFVTAPQDGFITKTIFSGIGETVKEGAELMSIMPANYDLAVAMYVKPMDLPLIEKGQEVRFMFDGWPSIVFSGWQNLSHGTFGGEVLAADNFISENGMYRVLVTPDTTEYGWPDGLRVGSGANGFALLKDVPVWYELWRRLNGFPPDFYKTNPEVSGSNVGSAKKEGK